MWDKYVLQIGDKEDKHRILVGNLLESGTFVTKQNIQQY